MSNDTPVPPWVLVMLAGLMEIKILLPFSASISKLPRCRVPPLMRVPLPEPVRLLLPSTGLMLMVLLLPLVGLVTMPKARGSFSLMEMGMTIVMEEVVVSGDGAACVRLPVSVMDKSSVVVSNFFMILFHLKMLKTYRKPW